MGFPGVRSYRELKGDRNLRPTRSRQEIRPYSVPNGGNQVLLRTLEYINYRMESESA